MKNKTLLFMVVVLSIVLVFIRSFKKKTSFFYNEIKIKNVSTGEIISMDIEEYLLGVLAGEMPASFSLEALKAQAVASRTYAYYKIKTSNKDYDVTNDNNSQVFITTTEMKTKWQEEYEYYFDKIKKAVKATENEVLTFDGMIIPAYYFSMSNGYTESSLVVFNEDFPFLKSVVSKENENHKNFKVTKSYTKDEFLNKLNISANELTITNVIINKSNRVQSLQINNSIFTGVEFRKILNLRSTDFCIDIDSDNINITTSGYGHGVGMSQYGANLMANEGYDYKEILFHYYSGVDILKVSSIK